jgi:hypothetical protein
MATRLVWRYREEKVESQSPSRITFLDALFEDIG